MASLSVRQQAPLAPACVKSIVGAWKINTQTKLYAEYLRCHARSCCRRPAFRSGRTAAKRRLNPESGLRSLFLRGVSVSRHTFVHVGCRLHKPLGDFDAQNARPSDNKILDGVLLDESGPDSSVYPAYRIIPLLGSNVFGECRIRRVRPEKRPRVLQAPSTHLNGRFHNHRNCRPAGPQSVIGKSESRVELLSTEEWRWPCSGTTSTLRAGTFCMAKLGAVTELVLH